MVKKTQGSSYCSGCHTVIKGILQLWCYRCGEPMVKMGVEYDKRKVVTQNLISQLKRFGRGRMAKKKRD
jgi:hypothetical protein